MLAAPGVAAVLLLTAFQPLTQLTLQPESRIWVKGTSTVRDYTCKAATIDAAIMAPAVETVSLPLDQLVRAAEVTIPVNTLDCGNGTMNDHMRKALKVADHANLGFTLENYAIENGNAIRLNGTLTLAGRGLPIEVEGTIAEEDGGLVRVTANKQIRMTEWGIKPPTLMLGTLKVHDPVTIGLDILIKR
jgi:polyisoprenoid-binding protein YceI